LRVIAHPGYSEFARFELRWIQTSLRKNNPRFSPPEPAEAIVSSRALDPPGPASGTRQFDRSLGLPAQSDRDSRRSEDVAATLWQGARL